MNKLMYSKWYQKAKFEALGFTPPSKIEEDCIEEYFTNYYLPLAYIAADVTRSYKSWISKIPQYTGQQDYDDIINAELKVSVNEVITYFSALTVGLAWIPELTNFIKNYRRNPQIQSVKENLYQDWERYMKTHKLQLGWFGVFNEEFGKDVYFISSKPAYVYSEDETYSGGNRIQKLKGLEFIHYDTSNIELARRILKSYPEFDKWVPRRDSVEQIVRGELRLVDSVPVTDLGMNGFPPIEAFQLYEVLPPAEKNMNESFTAAINYHSTIGSTMAKPIQDWLRSDNMLKYLEKYYNVPEETPTVKEDVLPVQVALPPKATLTTKQQPQEVVKPNSEDISDIKKRLEEETLRNIDLDYKYQQAQEELKHLRDIEEQLEGLKILQEDNKKMKEQLLALQSLSPTYEELSKENKQLKDQVQDLAEDVQTWQERASSLVRFDQELYEDSNIYRSASYALYLTRDAIPRNKEIGNNLNTAYLQSILVLLASAEEGRSLKDLLDIIIKDEKSNLSTYSDMREKLIKYIENEVKTS